MEEQQRKLQALQWHPAFFAGIQIELSEEADKLIFENEHQLGTKPKGIDVLIIKKNPEDTIHKNIGRIFRTYNIVEYKSPDDYLSIDDYYKVCGYACFYKSDVSHVDAIRASDITVSFVCLRYPHKLITYLKNGRHLCIEEKEEGIYYITGDVFPIQLIVTSHLSLESNLWLKNLTNDLQQGEPMNRLLGEYGRHQKDILYQSVMDIIIRANQEKFQEEKEMCDALLELYKDELEAGWAVARQEGCQEGREEGRREGRLEGIRALIEDNLEEGFSSKRIIEKLEKRFGLTDEEALNYFENYKA